MRDHHCFICLNRGKAISVPEHLEPDRVLWIDIPTGRLGVSLSENRSRELHWGAKKQQQPWVLQM